MKENVYKMVVRPVMLYGLETVALTIIEEGEGGGFRVKD